MPSINLEDMLLVKRKISTTNGVTVGVIGCGGTGSLFVRDAMRVLNVFHAQELAQGRIGVKRTFFCDADIVEEKNLVRQNFILPDIGRNKAQVLAERYGSAFNMDIEVIPRFLEQESDLYQAMVDRSGYSYYNNRPTIILFSMVDNVKTRLMISNVMHGYISDNGSSPSNLGCDMIVVDCGNSEYAGQVCISATESGSERFYLPSVAELQPDLLDPTNWDKFASELSCEESAISDPQTISANATAANIAVNTLYNLIYKGGVDYNKVVFNSQNNCTTTNFIRRNNRTFPAYTAGRIDYTPALIRVDSPIHVAAAINAIVEGETEPMDTPVGREFRVPVITEVPVVAPERETMDFLDVIEEVIEALEETEEIIPTVDTPPAPARRHVILDMIAPIISGETTDEEIEEVLVDEVEFAVEVIEEFEEELPEEFIEEVLEEIATEQIEIPVTTSETVPIVVIVETPVVIPEIEEVIEIEEELEVEEIIEDIIQEVVEDILEEVIIEEVIVEEEEDEEYELPEEFDDDGYNNETGHQEDENGIFPGEEEEEIEEEIEEVIVEEEVVTPHVQTIEEAMAAFDDLPGIY